MNKNKSKKQSTQKQFTINSEKIRKATGEIKKFFDETPDKIYYIHTKDKFELKGLLNICNTLREFVEGGVECKNKKIDSYDEQLKTQIKNLYHFLSGKETKVGVSK